MGASFDKHHGPGQEGSRMIDDSASGALTVGVVQRPPVFLNLAATIELAHQLIADAAANGARLLVFPETWLPGYPVWLDYAPGTALWGNSAGEALFAHLFANSPTLDGPEFAELRKLSADHGVDLMMGAHERSGNSLYNVMVMIGADGLFGVHRKLTPTFSERLIWGQGDGSTLSAWDRPYGRVGGLICWEHWMPLARAAMHAQHELIHVAQWPAVGEKHLLASRNYAFEGQCFVIAGGSVATRDDVIEGYLSAGGGKDGLALLETIPLDPALLKDGGSCIIAPDASILAQSPAGNRETLYCALPLELAHRGKLYLDSDGHYARPDVFELKVNRRANRSVSFSGEGDQ